jgi:hypothetical protein
MALTLGRNAGWIPVRLVVGMIAGTGCGHSEDLVDAVR